MGEPTDAKPFASFENAKAACRADKMVFKPIVDEAFEIRKDINAGIWSLYIGEGELWEHDIDPETWQERPVMMEGARDLMYSVEKGDDRCCATMTAKVGDDEYEGVVFDVLNIADKESVVMFTCDNGDRLAFLIAEYDRTGEEEIWKPRSFRPRRV